MLNTNWPFELNQLQCSFQTRTNKNIVQLDRYHIDLKNDFTQPVKYSSIQLDSIRHNSQCFLSIVLVISDLFLDVS